MLENKTIVISIAVILFILIILSQTFMKKERDVEDKKNKKDVKENYIREDFAGSAMNVLYSDSTGNLSSTTDLGLNTLNVVNHQLKIGNWSIRTGDGHFRLYYDNSQQFVVHAPISNNTEWSDVTWSKRLRAEGKITEYGSPLIPRGMIMLWSGAANAIPGGWVLCNGANGTPNLQDRFVVGAGSDYGVNATGGNNTITLSVGQLPAHNHTMNTAGWHGHGVSDPGHSHTFGDEYALHGGNRIDSGSNLTSANVDDRTSTNTTGITINGDGNHTHSINDTGSGHGIDIRPLYYALCYIMKT